MLAESRCAGHEAEPALIFNPDPRDAGPPDDAEAAREIAARRVSPVELTRALSSTTPPG